MRPILRIPRASNAVLSQRVFELKDSDESKWYRLVYLARVEDTIYVLHCFTKNTAKTEKRDLATAEAKVLAGDAGAARDVEFLFVSIRRRLHDREAIRRETIAKYALARAKAWDFWSANLWRDDCW